MYSLRRLTTDGYEHNFLLGDTYSKVLKRKVSKEEWDSVSENYWGEGYHKKKINVGDENIPERDCYGFVFANGTTHFLLPWQENYIVTESGSTFEKL